MDILSYNDNDAVKKLTIQMSNHIANKEIASYLKTLLKSSSYGSVRKLTVDKECLHDADLLPSIPNYSQFSARHIQLKHVDILESALEALSVQLPQLDILDLSNCAFKSSTTEPAGRNININIVNTYCCVRITDCK